MVTQAEFGKVTLETAALGEVQLLLAEKRTSLATIRTGIALLVLPFSALSFLIVTSRYYRFVEVMHLMLPVVVVCVTLLGLGSYLIIRGVIQIHRQDQHILELKGKHSEIAALIDN